MRHEKPRSPWAAGLITLACCGLIGADRALEAHAQTHARVPSATSRRALPPPAPTTKQTAKPATPPTPPEEPLPSIDFVNYDTDDRTGITRGTQFVYKEKDATITGDRAIWNGNEDKQTLDAEGHLVFDDPTHHATAERAHVNDLTKSADFEGNVVLVLKPSPAHPGDAAAGKDDRGDSVKRHGVTVTCDKLHDEYDENKKQVKMYGHLVFSQSYKTESGEVVERTLTAEHAEYDGKAETMVLFPPIAGHNNRGETFNQDKDTMTLGTKEGQETISGHNGHLVFRPRRRVTDSGAQTSGTSAPPQKAPKEGAPGEKPPTGGSGGR